MNLRIRNIHEDTSGGIEGLPLQLMIMILVATLGTAIIIGWMGNIEEPHSIGDVDVDPEKIDAVDGTFGFTVYVEDQSGDPLEGATVMVVNSNVKDADGRTPLLTTSDSGEAVFSGLTMERHDKVGFVTLNISKPGYGEKEVKVVVRF